MDQSKEIALVVVGLCIYRNISAVSSYLGVHGRFYGLDFKKEMVVLKPWRSLD